jgi:hypothetical protein
VAARKCLWNTARSYQQETEDQLNKRHVRKFATKANSLLRKFHSDMFFTYVELSSSQKKQYVEQLSCFTEEHQEVLLAALFIQTALESINFYHFDGIDMDEKTGMPVAMANPTMLPVPLAYMSKLLNKQVYQKKSLALAWSGLTDKLSHAKQVSFSDSQDHLKPASFGGQLFEEMEQLNNLNNRFIPGIVADSNAISVNASPLELDDESRQLLQKIESLKQNFQLEEDVLEKIMKLAKKDLAVLQAAKKKVKEFPQSVKDSLSATTLNIWNNRKKLSFAFLDENEKRIRNIATVAVALNLEKALDVFQLTYEVRYFTQNHGKDMQAAVSIWVNECHWMTRYYFDKWE